MNQGLSSRYLPFLALCVLVLPVLNIAEARAEDPFPLRLSEDRRYLVDRSGDPFLISGDTAWSLIPALTKAETSLYLDDRRRKGFNAIIVQLVENHFSGPENRDGQQPFIPKGDFSAPNEAYFAHADWVIREARDRGIAVLLFPAYVGYGCGHEGWCAELVDNGPENLRDYGRYLGQRYGDFGNIIWAAGGDADAREFSAAMEATRAMIAEIRKYDRDALFTAHCHRHRSAMECYNEPWLDINTTYADCGTTAAHSLRDYFRSKPFLYIEGTYESEEASAVCLRSQAYRSLLSGSMGHFFGNNPIWHFGSVETLFPYEGTWVDALQSAGADSMMHMVNLFASRNWTALVPDANGTYLVSDHGDALSDGFVASAVNTDRTTFFAYLPSKASVTVDTRRLGSSEVRAWWYDPAAGKACPAGDFANGRIVFEPPADGDWVLVLDHASLNLAAPGHLETGHNSHADGSSSC